MKRTFRWTRTIAALVTGPLLVVCLWAAGARPAAGADPAEGETAKQKAPPVTVDAIVLDPDSPPPDTLCKLRVKLTNHTERDVSGLGFRVTVNGTPLSVYDNQRYMEVLEPGASREIELYNFWSSETGRPPRKDGSLAVEVALIEARYLKRTKEEDVPVWTLLEEVPGLPSVATMGRPKG